jgi:hypothetical protein
MAQACHKTKNKDTCRGGYIDVAFYDVENRKERI